MSTVQQSSVQQSVQPGAIGPRQIVICCDGTNNTLTGGPRDTNVLKIITQLVPGDSAQLMYYDPGVGSPDQLPALGILNWVNRKRQRIAGLAKGSGVYENIADAYLFLVEHYQKDDEVYIFGFSRGAFTARAVAGMVSLFGLIRSESKSLILTLIHVYFSTPSAGSSGAEGFFARHVAKRAALDRQEDQAVHDKRLRDNTAIPGNDYEHIDALQKYDRRLSTREEVADEVKQFFTSLIGKDAKIYFIGVWDTVASVGIPILSERSIPSDGTTKEKAFVHIRQALSLDEHRSTFKPRLYWDNNYWEPIVPGTQTEEERKDPRKNKSLKQRWFRGVHSDVGGGYDRVEAGLSDCSYAWILNEARACGLRTIPKLTNTEWMKKPYIAHDECAATPWWGVAGLVPRSNRIKNKKEGTETIVPIDQDSGMKIYNQPVALANFFGRNKGWLIFNILFSLLMAWMASRYAYAALHGGSLVDYAKNPFDGSACFDFWQRYFGPFGCSVAHVRKMEIWPSYAYHALLFDFLFILSYSWVLGLFAGWAFREILLNRRPDAKPNHLLGLGWAPCWLVFANVAEIVLTILTLWLLDHHIRGITSYSRFVLPDPPYGWWVAMITAFDKPGSLPHFWISDISGVLLTVANCVKWLGVIGSLALIIWGVVCRIMRWRAESKAAPKADPDSPARAAATLDMVPVLHAGAAPVAGAAPATASASGGSGQA